MAQKYRKKPVVIEAMQWTGDNEEQLMAWSGGAFCPLDVEDCGDNPDETGSLYVAANSVHLGVVTGEWVLKDSAGFYPCKADIFAATYEPVKPTDPIVKPTGGVIIR